MAIKKSQLYSALWESCNALRGSMDASQYKDYVLMMLFVRYLSDKARQNQIRLTVPDGCYFEDFVSLRNNDHIGEKINEKLEAIRDANATFIGDLVLPNFNDKTKLGEGKTMVDTLSKLISVFDKNELDFSRNRAADDDLLGDAYEYLMKNFAAESGKSKGQFYTPAEVSRVIAKVLHLEDLDKRSYSIYDPTCGSGSLLLRALAETPRGVSLRGQEKDSTTASLAKLNMLLHGIVNAQIKVGDTLNNPQFLSAGTIETFDVCVANPPFSQKNWLSTSSETGGENDRYHRWSETLLPPAKCGDYAFLLHLIASMNEGTGRGACILPHGVLFRGNAEYTIRKYIVDQRYIKGIIGLPPNIFFGTGIPASIIIIDKKDKDLRQGIFFIDAKDGFMKDGAKNRLREQDIRRIVDTWDAQRDVPHYARFVPYNEICSKQNDYNLNIPRYIVPEDNEVHQDIQAHLHGGIPSYDVDRMQHYWDACSGLKESLFTKKSDGYYSLIPKKDAISDTVNSNEGFRHQKEIFSATIEKWETYVREKMFDTQKNAIPKALIADWSGKLLEIVKGSDGLEDPYQIYDLLMNYWQDVMQDDCYMVSNDGWTYPEVKAIKRTETFSKKKKEVTVKESKCYYDEIVCDLLPVQVVLDEFFKNESEEIEKKKAELDAFKSELNSFVEDNLDAFDFSEEDEDNGEDEDETEGIKIVEKDVNGQIKALEASRKDNDTLAVLKEWKSRNETRKKMDKALKELQAGLTANVLAKYAELPEPEVQRLVIDRKWLPAIESSFNSEMQNIAQRISSDVTAVAERYESTLPEISDKVSEYEGKVLASLKEMGFEI